MINHVNNWEKANKEHNNKSVTAELERYKEQVKTFEQRLNIDLSSREKLIDSLMDDMIKEKLALKEQGYQNPFYLKKAQRIKPTLYDGIVISAKHVAMPVIDDEETLILEEESRSKIKPSDASLVKIETPKELPKVSSVNESLKKLKFYLARFDNVVKIRTTPDAHTEVFDQMDAAVQQSSVDKQCLEIAKKELLLKNDRLLQQIMSQDVLLTVMNSMSLIGESVNMDRKRKESCDKCVNLEAELLKSQNAHNDLLKSYSQLEKHCISFELSTQLNQEIFQKDKSCDNQNALEIPEFFENNDLKAQLKDKDTTICKLKDIIKSMREKSKEENVFKDQFDSIKKTRVSTKEQSDSLIDKLNLKCAENEDLKDQIQDTVFVITSLKNDLRKLKGKEIVDIVAQTPYAYTIVPGMFKQDLEPLAPRLLQNREAHIDYLKYTQEQADILQGIVKQAKAKQPLDNALDFACKHAQRIQELLVYVRDTCPNAIKLSTKKVDVTPKNNVKKGLKCSTSNCGSKPTSNKKNDRISQTPSRNMKNKVEAQPRKINKKNCGVEPISEIDVKHSLKANSKLICTTCKKSMFDGVHDMCLLDFVENVVQIVLWYLDSGCSKHMKRNRSQLMNFVSKFLGYHISTFGTLNKLAKDGLARDIPRLKFQKDHLFSRTKDEAPEAVIKCIKNMQVHLNATVRNVRTDNGTECVNQTLREFYENNGISHQTYVARSPQQNGVVERRNRTLVEAARTMLIFSKALLFLWAEAINTACYT
ncbi:retrovirus-related pol polyprotein from transposon TNT 1-94 [Tanacetum coccineum]|uniref:Retrovirus-related pol polyprotein from transposon TNT 1-94 n=1 Tax=Tanacetum coccineum TaxID=301880 RepID=A0ABQ4ZI46_9ASTR